jgi:stage II sporulation protein D
VIDREPTIQVGILEHRGEIRGVFGGGFTGQRTETVKGSFRAAVDRGEIVVTDDGGHEIERGGMIDFLPTGESAFVLQDVTIGIRFHWQRDEDQKFEGALKLILGSDGLLVAINVISVERYLKSVISSEMSAEAPIELLKAHAITSRSWLVAMLERERRNVGLPSRRSIETTEGITRWYDREDHDRFDVCADDHCQRYQGVSKIISPAVHEAVDATRGVFLVHGGRICDARFSKACGGISEEFQNVWEDQRVPYLQHVSDADVVHPPILSESDAERWIRTSPKAFCNTADGAILRQVLPSYDRETTDFFRWRVSYTQEALQALLSMKSGIDFGPIKALVPLKRGPSSRIVKLRIEGMKRRMVVGKELEIRRWLSESHLYSSAFLVETEGEPGGAPERFVLRGAGWGHGVGLCQIGAAVMATRRYTAEQIVLHYFRGANLERLYS